MTTPTITPYPGDLPAKEQSNPVLDTNVDNFLTWLTDTNGPELVTFVTYAQDVADNVLATALAGDLPPLTGKAGDYIRANAAEDGGEFRTPQELAGDLSAFLASHKPVNVSGATPSLDVATYNFFDQGALTADTTVSFASVPTEDKWQYSYVAAVDANAVFDLGGASYNGKSFGVASQEGDTHGLAFNADGTSMFIIGTQNDTVYQYTLSTGFDVSTASYASKSFSISSQDSNAQDLAFSNDGTKMYVVGDSNNTIFEYTLSTGFDVSTASYNSVNFSVASQDNSPNGVAFNADGTSMFIAGGANSTVYQYTLSTGFLVSTASYASKSFDTGTQVTSLEGLMFNTDGTIMIAMDGTGDTLYQYTLSTGFDVSTASYASKSLDVSSKESIPRGLAFSASGTSLFAVGLISDTVYQYTLASTYSLTLPTIVGTPSATDVGDRVTYTFVTKDSGTTVNLIAEDIIQ